MTTRQLLKTAKDKAITFSKENDPKLKTQGFLQLDCGFPERRAGCMYAGYLTIVIVTYTLARFYKTPWVFPEPKLSSAKNWVVCQKHQRELGFLW